MINVYFIYNSKKVLFYEYLNWKNKDKNEIYFWLRNIFSFFFLNRFFGFGFNIFMLFLFVVLFESSFSDFFIL